MTLASDLNIRSYTRRKPDVSNGFEFVNIALPYVSILGPYAVDNLHLAEHPEQKVGPGTYAKFCMDNLGAGLRPFVKGAQC